MGEAKRGAGEKAMAGGATERPGGGSGGAPVLVIHGGAGTIARAGASASAQAAYREALHAVLQAGQRLLQGGADALDVVTEAVRLLEECPLFNAGRGAVYTAEGRHELDACVMRGRDRAAGAVAGVTRLRNPVLAARAVLDAAGEEGAPVLMFGAGAERFAIERGCEQVPAGWFGTPHRLAQLHALQGSRRTALDHAGEPAPRGVEAGAGAGAGVSALVGASAGAVVGASADAPPLDERGKFGTVGAVALDVHGHLAAATSTGGMTNKRPGRIGDSPIVGAGCYANDATVAVSCTGTGEAFLRGLAAYDVSALVEFAGLSLTEAARRVIAQRLPALGGDGGLIAVDRNGLITAPFNTEGMYRGSVRAAGPAEVAIYAGEAFGG